MKRNLYKLLIVACIGALLMGCQANPQERIITSKNDGFFDAQAIQNATVAAEDTLDVQFHESFLSTDGSIEFSANIDESISGTPMPAIEVVPHYLSGEDAKRVAKALFGDATFYEREPSADPTYSKSQLQEKINRLSKYTNQEELRELLGRETDLVEQIDYIKQQIDTYTHQLEFAPEENPHILCDWTMKKIHHYNNSRTETEGRNIANDSDVIYATVQLNNVEYIFTATTRNKRDYKLNTIQVGLTSGVGLLHIDQAIYRATLCRTEEPTANQISTIQTKAQKMLDQMNLGEWYVINAAVQTTYLGETPEYQVVISAVPGINGIPCIWGQQVASNSDAYASNYPISYATFEFSANGELVSFLLRSPFDTQHVINRNVATVPMAELEQKAKSYLSRTDVYTEFCFPSDYIRLLENRYEEDLIAKINITDMDYGMARVKVPETDDSYYYIPAIVYKGTVDYYGKNSGTLYMGSSDFANSLVNLVWLNAIDGSIIDG